MTDYQISTPNQMNLLYAMNEIHVDTNLPRLWVFIPILQKMFNFRIYERKRKKQANYVY